MNFKLKNSYLAPSINFISNIKAKGKKARAVVKVKKLLLAKHEELQEDSIRLVAEYGQRDPDGELIPVDVTNPNGDKVIAKEFATIYMSEFSQLMNEEVEIAGGTYVNHIDEIKEILENYDVEISGMDAEAYDALLDALEESNELKGGE